MLPNEQITKGLISLRRSAGWAATFFVGMREFSQVEAELNVSSFVSVYLRCPMFRFYQLMHILNPCPVVLGFILFENTVEPDQLASGEVI